MRAKIGIILPAAYSGGTLRGAINAAIQVHDGSKVFGDDITVEFGYVDVGQAEIHKGFRDLESRGIIARPIRVEYHKADRFLPAGHDPTRDDRRCRYIVFNDGISNFDDADFLVIISDRLGDGIIASGCRFGILVYDFIQRYVPEIFDDGDLETVKGRWLSHTLMMKNFSRAQALFVTTEQTRSDAISFGGVPANKVIKLPMEFDPVRISRLLKSPCHDASPAKRNDGEGGYILWCTNTTQHKNHLRALRAFEMIYADDDDLPGVYMTGVYTDAYRRGAQGIIADLAYVRQVRHAIWHSRLLSRKVKIMGELPDHDYVRTLKRALILFHPALYDNGTFSVVEAAWHGVPSLSSLYPAMREMDVRFGLNLLYFDPYDIDGMAQGILTGINSRDKLRAELPPPESLTRFERERNAPSYWEALRPAISGSL